MTRLDAIRKRAEAARTEDSYKVLREDIPHLLDLVRELREMAKISLDGAPHSESCQKSWDLPFEERTSWRTRNKVECDGCYQDMPLRRAIARCDELEAPNGKG